MGDVRGAERSSNVGYLLLEKAIVVAWPVRHELDRVGSGLQDNHLRGDDADERLACITQSEGCANIEVDSLGERRSILVAAFCAG